jgi:hypothetical protein
MNLTRALISAVMLMATLTSVAIADEHMFVSRVTLDSSHIDAFGNVFAFVPTGSDDPVCLATPNDSNAYNVGPSPTICLPRMFNGQKGVAILMIPYFAPWPTSNLILVVSVYQKGAQFYGTPVLYRN